MSANALMLPELTGRGQIVVDYFKRETILIAPALERIFPDLQPEARRKFMERLCLTAWFNKYRFPGGSGNYWMLSSRACNHLGIKRRSSAFNQAPLRRLCLQSLFFALSPHLRHLTPEECKSMSPDIVCRGDSKYFLDATNVANALLGWLVIDDGKSARRIWSKASAAISKRKKVQLFYDLCRARRFRISVVTTTVEKAEKIQKVLLDHPFKDVSIEVVPVAEAMPSLLLSKEEQ